MQDVSRTTHPTDELQRRADEVAIADRAEEYQIEQNRRWAALEASVPCSHTIPGTCDYCGGDR